MVQRAEPFGIDLGKPHHVVLAEPRSPKAALDRAATLIERLVVQRFGDREVLVATKDGRIVVLLPGVSAAERSGQPVEVGAVLRRKLERVSSDQWRVAAGRAFPGAYGVARSYEEAREALALADRLGIDGDVIEGRDLLVYRVVGRDQAAIADLVREVLGPLEQTRGGPAVLLETLRAYFAVGDVATEAARTLHVSVRTVTYRLARVAELTGYSLARPDQRFALQAAVVGARLLDWPRRPLPAS
jgi:sugar diacid utilization regulator